MRQFLFALLLIPVVGSAQSVYTVKTRIDTSITQKTGARTITAQAVGQRISEVAELVERYRDSARVSAADGNNFLTSLSWNSGTGNLTAGRSGLSSVAANLDGRYLLLSGAYSDPSWIASLSAGKINGLASVAVSGEYSDLKGQPALGTAAARNVPASGNASISQVVIGSDTRLSDARTPVSHLHSPTDIAQAGATVGQVLKWTGSAWAPGTDATGGGGGGVVSVYQTVWVDSAGSNGTGVVGDATKPFITINAALDATASLPARRIIIGLGAYAAPDNSKIKSNTVFQGSGVPNFNWTVVAGAYPDYSYSTPTRLIGGTRIMGGILLDGTDKNNVAIYSLGVDVGSDWVAAGNAAADGISSYVTGSVLSGQKLNTGLRIKDVIVLQSSPTVGYHGIVTQGCYMPIVENATVWGGFAGFVSKNIGGYYHNITVYSNGTYGIVPKTDVYAYCMREVYDGFRIEGGAGLYVHTSSGNNGMPLQGVMLMNGYLNNVDYGVVCLEGTENSLFQNIRAKLKPSVAGTVPVFDLRQAKNTIISNCTATGGQVGFQIFDASTVRVSGCIADGTTGFDYMLQGHSSSEPLLFQGNIGKKSGSTYIYDNVWGGGNFVGSYAGSGTLNPL